VTGAGSGIGEAVISHFRREGARLPLTGRREQLDSAEPDDLYVPGDLHRLHSSLGYRSPAGSETALAA
jgi:dihydroanticapsin dehydrogenase